MPQMETVDLDTDLSLFKYDNLEQLPPAYRELDEAERTRRIEAAKAELGDDVVVLGHNYQRREIVEHADFVGDSYQLSKEAAAADASLMIMFVGALLVLLAGQSPLLFAAWAALTLVGGGAYLLAREILQADTIHFLVGQSINEFYQNPLLPKNISIRRNLVEDLINLLRRYQKEVSLEYC